MGSLEVGGIFGVFGLDEMEIDEDEILVGVVKKDSFGFFSCQ